MHTTLENNGDQMRIHHELDWFGTATVSFVHRTHGEYGTREELREWHVDASNLHSGHIGLQLTDTKKRDVPAEIVARAVVLACRTWMKREMTLRLESL